MIQLYITIQLNMIAGNLQLLTTIKGQVKLTYAYSDTAYILIAMQSMSYGLYTFLYTVGRLTFEDTKFHGFLQNLENVYRRNHKIVQLYCLLFAHPRKYFHEMFCFNEAHFRNVISSKLSCPIWYYMYASKFMSCTVVRLTTLLESINIRLLYQSIFIDLHCISDKHLYVAVKCGKAQAPANSQVTSLQSLISVPL